jgi:predicted nucleic-acid-binding protein
MNAVDTNILVQYMVKDDAEQFAKADAFLKGRTSDDPAFISLIVLVELTWVLRRLYRYSREQVHSVMTLMIETAGLTIEDEFFVSTLISHGAVLKDELADHLIAHSALKAGCARTVTFDRAAAARVPSMELLS